MCHPKSRRCKCLEFELLDNGNVALDDNDKPERGHVILSPEEMCGFIKEIKDGRWDEYYDEQVATF